jgi:hypothetical protein
MCGRFTQNYTWADLHDALDVIGQAPESALREWVVSKRVNRAGYGDDDPTLTEAV